ncbi:P-loop containing nucleoside triphosphate hydrolase protein [Halteromyces radiatus]|uniref:P-loop containing nucleoside triphosphate hydrolase protein n=1 Tax=Halteromyces radiatus TaxID=101107 RepID=UPI0022207F97|nr:P-loop containing nucleoside triphosphate hydrolase protein [Halteromyces radiatus]KAI8099713.1 P-loop containing nucleoside triphosphate hydrolase protein [Halteromyces radiatus]
MDRKQNNQQLKIEGSGVINAIRDRRTSVKFHLRSSTEIGIRTGDNGYSLLSCLRQLPNIRFDSTTQEWILPATYHHYVQAYENLLTSPYYRYVQCTPLSDIVINVLRQDQSAYIKSSSIVSASNTMDDDFGDDVTDWELQKADREAQVEERIYNNLKPCSIWNNLMEYQQHGVRKCLFLNGRVLLADDMGLGKTIQALAVAMAYPDTWPVLVICPTSLLLPWADHIQQWLSNVKNNHIRITLKGSDLFGYTPATVKPILTSSEDDIDEYTTTNVDIQYDTKNEKFDQPLFYIISYDLAANHCDQLLNMDFKFIICDESHNMKNPQTKRTKALTPLLQKSQHVILLTGTPILSRPIELYPQLYILRKDLFPDMHQYGLLYCNGQLTKFGWNYNGSSNLSELHFLLERSVMIRRLKENIEMDTLSLPSLVRQKVLMPIDPSKKRFLSKLQSDLARLRSCPGTEFICQQKSIELYMETGVAKIPAVTHYLHNLLMTTKDQMVVFAYHKAVLDAIEEMMKNNKFTYIRIDGNTKQSLRHELCQKFQGIKNERNETIRVALLSITTSNTGLNLQMANTVVFAELYFNPSQILQAEARAHRIGQLNTVYIKYLLSQDTGDVWLWSLLCKKLQVTGKVLDEKSKQFYLEST